MKPFSRKIAVGVACITLLGAWWVWTPRFKVRELVSFPGGIQDYAVSSQGLVAVTGGSSTSTEERTLTLIDDNGSVSQVKATAANGAINGVNFSPDGRKLAGNSYGGLWIAEIEQAKIAGQISTPPQATGNFNFWDLRDVSRPALFREGLVWCITPMSGQSSTILASRWKTNDAGFADRKSVHLTPPPSFRRVQLVLSPDGTKVGVLWQRIRMKGAVTRRYDKQGIIEVWDIVQARKLCELEEIEPRGLGPLAFSPDAKYIAAADSAGSGYIWETQSGQIVQTLSGLRHKERNQPNSYTMGYDGAPFYPPIKLAFTTDNRTVIAALNDSYIIAYNLESGLPLRILARRDKPIDRLTVSPDNRKLYFVEDEKSLTWERDKRQTLYSLPLPEFPEAS